MPLTAKQIEARKILGGPATHCLLFGGSRSGKTVLIVRTIVLRAVAAKESRHVIFRFRFNHVKASIVLDTFPKVMSLFFPQVVYKIDKTDWFATIEETQSQVWFAGLDDKERTEKILGGEFVTIYLNEASQIPWQSRNLALTRLAQSCTHSVGGSNVPMRRKFYYDCNPPSQSHWTYQVFVKGRDPDTKQTISNPEDYAHCVLNPADNLANLPAGYLDTLRALPARMRTRFLDGEYSPLTTNALWTFEGIETWRVIGDTPAMVRVVVAVDPSGSGDVDNADNDAIGIVVAGLGIDGNGYVLEDCTLKAGPSTWGNVVVTAFDRWSADRVVGEGNYGGAMVEHVIQTARRRTPYKKVTATRGKAVRADPVSALAEQGRIRHAGKFPDLEDELCAFTTAGYIGPHSPNRADAYVWAFTELFGGIVAEDDEEEDFSPVTTIKSGYAL